MKTSIVGFLSTLILVTAVVWLVIQPSPEPLVAALAALVGVLSQIRDRATPAEEERVPTDAPLDAERSLLVMPLANLSSDLDNEYFSDGLTEELIAALAHVPSLRVISRHSAMRLKGTERPLVELARDLSVDFVVEGGVRKSGEAVRITIHLVDADRDTELWTETYNGTLEDIFALQEGVARAIVDALHLRFAPEQIDAGQAPADPRALEAYLRGRHEMGNWTRESSENARRFFLGGLEILGENALLHAGFGHASFRLAHIVPGAMTEYMAEAEAAARRALELDPNLLTAHVLSGLVDWKRGSIGSALRHFLDAVSSDPDDADALTWAAFCFAEVGDLRFAGDHAERLVLVDPLNAFSRWVSGFVHLMNNNLSDASQAFEQSLSFDPTSTNTLVLKAFVEVRLGRSEVARERLEAMLQLGQEGVWTHLGAALLSALVGRSPELPDHVITASRKDETFAWFTAECYAMVGQVSDVIEWLDHALKWGFSNDAFVQSDASGLSALQGDPAFAEWLARSASKRKQIFAELRPTRP